MKIDIEKLKKAITDGIETTATWESECSVIGVYRGRQIQLKITRDNDDFLDSPSRKLFCITNWETE